MEKRRGNFENQSMFEGIVYLDEEGKSVNEESYDICHTGAGTI